MKKFLLKNSGFTLIEIMVALVIAMGIITSLVYFSTSAIQQIRSVKYAQQLNDNAASLANNFTYWIKQAKSLNVPSPTQLVITLPDSSKTFQQNGNTITLDGTPVLGSNVEVTNLTFTQMPRSVRISYTLRLQNTNETITINTTLTQRNSL